MKKPILKETKDFEKPDDVVKIMGEQHFCPICDKPTTKYYYEYFSDGSYDDSEIDTDNSWWWIDPDEMMIEIYKDGCSFVYGEYYEDKDLIFFSKAEYKKIHKNILSIFKLFQDFYKEYGKKYARETKSHFGTDQPSPYFCSKECVKSFIISKLKNINL